MPVTEILKFYKETEASRVGLCRNDKCVPAHPQQESDILEANEGGDNGNRMGNNYHQGPLGTE